MKKKNFNTIRTGYGRLLYLLPAALLLGAMPVAGQHKLPVNTADTIACAPLKSKPDTGQNYILVNTPRVPITHTAGLAAGSVCQLNQTIQYLDGLGRPLQTVQVKASPRQKDIVLPAAYDGYGRVTKKYEPYADEADSAASGSFRPAMFADQAAFYSSLNAAPAPGVVRTDFPFSQLVPEASPLSRPLEQGAQGAAWQPGTGHTVTISYTNNGNGFDAQFYTAAVNADGSRALALHKEGPGNLYVTVSRDENWVSGKTGTTEQYTDRKGHVVLKRMWYSESEFYLTYYVYDDLDNLAFVLPPAANGDDGVSSDTGQQLLDNLCYQYRYDDRNRMTAKKLPGKGWEYMVYNSLDQLVASQDSMQRAQSQWIFTKYDAIGRVVMTGLKRLLGSSRQGVQAMVDSQGILWEKPDAAPPYGYSNSAWPLLVNNMEILTVNYYDGYTGIPGLPARYSAPDSANLKPDGMLTATLTEVLSLKRMLLKVNYYDDLGRNIKTYKQHFYNLRVDSANYDAVTSTYNFTNAITSVTRNHYNVQGGEKPLLTIADSYIYDHNGRKTKTWQQVTSIGNLLPRTLLSQVDYNEIGQVMTKHLHSTDSLNFLQDVDYTYNERGWLLSSTAPLFADTLYYNKYQQGLTPQFNGNIAGQRWTTDMVASNQVFTKKQFVNSFAYTYDPLNRLTSGITADSAYAEYGIRYDKGGNILALNRVFDHDLVDSLNYNYISGLGYSNQLQSLSDDARSEMPDAHASGTFGYTYDGNGNMTADSSKHISITYNLLNLPTSVSLFRFPGELITGNSTIGSYIYDANGDKLASTSSTNTSSIINYYIDGIQYTGNGVQPQLSFVQTEEGRMFPYSTDTSAYYQYYLTDHLGNTRVAFDNAGGNLTVKQQDDYLPFGMEINRSLAGSPKNEYLYNRKELQENMQLYDYGARFYDPVLGRWTSVDPLAEKFSGTSPYMYTYDDPIKHNDPDGKSGEVSIDNTNHTVTITSKMIFYGNAANADLASKTASDVQNQWNAANGKVIIGGQEYSVKFSITGSYRNDLTQKEVNANSDVENNYIDVVQNGIAVSHMDDTGSNTGEYLSSNISGVNETTAAHEMGHGWGAVAGTPDGHNASDSDLRGQGQPNMMSARGTLVDAKYTLNPSKGTSTVDYLDGGKAKNTMNPNTRKVTQKDINYLNLDKLQFDSKGKAKLGKTTNTFHQ